ncbi:MAG: hypothetical protein Pg6B_06400 [Candidatus Azobacteroides pseudotrichonymphae]|nr:MAG: hypothetical protein Pg6B_06400 [Candidatus Azobacteroides pseudotrichonymphae]
MIEEKKNFKLEAFDSLRCLLLDRYLNELFYSRSSECHVFDRGMF